MSLFKAREWWTTSVNSEVFDQGHLCVANIDNSPSGGDKIILGNFNGLIRIFNPHGNKEGSSVAGNSIPEDVMLEIQLSSPILQIEAGRFVSASERLHLAVLHPRKLAVYSVAGMIGNTDHGSQYQLNLMYEHNLQRTAYCMTFGPFGGVKGKDFVCVQSMDGILSIFEQESFAFSRFLPNFLLPGPLKYMPRSDSFITVSCNWQVENYKYQVLAVATDSQSKEEKQKLTSGKRVAADWSFNLGEVALDIAVVIYQQALPSIFILGERNLFCLKENGQLRFMKKFDYNPSCFLPYATVMEGSINTLIVTCTSTLMIYQDITLKWASQLSYLPVAIRLATFRDLKGVIVTLDDQGHLSCWYLGTDPSLFVIPPTTIRDINYNEQEEEMKQFQKVIKDYQKSNLPKNKNEDPLSLIVQLPSSLDNISCATEVAFQEDSLVPSITVKVELVAQESLENVMININIEPPLVASLTEMFFPSIKPFPDNSGEDTVMKISFYLKYGFVSTSLQAQITASFLMSTGAPRIIQANINLPLKLLMKPVAPIKNATYKVTVDTNQPPVNLNDLFSDMHGETGDSLDCALGLKFYGGPVITILASKSSQRYRIQCESFDAMWLVISEFVIRLLLYFKQKPTDFKCSVNGGLPLQEYFEFLDAHFECRSTADKYKELLKQQAEQFRIIEKRLLTRFKDKTPSQLSNLDILLDGTYRQILAIADAIEMNRLELLHRAKALSAATLLLNLLIKLWCNLNDKEFVILQACLSPVILDNSELGWEEITDAAITHLLRTCLAKTAKDQSSAISPMSMPKDTLRLKKHIALLCDRLSKGGHLSLSHMIAPKITTITKRGSVDDDANFDESEVPMGSTFGSYQNFKKCDLAAPRDKQLSQSIDSLNSIQ